MRFVFFVIFSIFFIGCGSTKPATTQDWNYPQGGNSGAPSSGVKGGGVSMRVLWTVSEYRLGKNAAWGRKDAAKLLFKPLDIDSNSITFDGKICRDIVFVKKNVNAEEYLGNLFHVSPLSLDIKDRDIEVVKTNCDLPGFSEYIRLKDRRLIINIKGIFFFLEPAVTY